MRNNNYTLESPQFTNTNNNELNSKSNYIQQFIRNEEQNSDLESVVKIQQFNIYERANHTHTGFYNSANKHTPMGAPSQMNKPTIVERKMRDLSNNSPDGENHTTLSYYVDLTSIDG